MWWAGMVKNIPKSETSPMESIFVHFCEHSVDPSNAMDL